MKITYRIWQREWYTDEAFEALCASIERWKDDIDELALFVGLAHHGYYPLSACRECVPVLRARMQTLREMGIASVGVNLWSTLGHLDEAWDWLKRPPFQTVVGHDGRTSLSCGCPRNEDFLRYAQELYATVAASGPDFIWLDDDVRMHEHHVGFPCFCHDCVEKFNSRAGTSFNRERMVRALEAPDCAALRERFLSFNAEAMNELCRLLAQAVRGVDPAIRVGLMTTAMDWNSYSLSNQRQMLNAMRADMVRPGGGFYHDEQPLALLDKAMSVALQNAYAQGISDIQYELEDFPISYNKSVRFHLIELTSAFMAGCSGIALNSVIPNEPRPLMEALHSCYPMWRHIVSRMPGTALRGYCPVYIPEVDAKERSTHTIFSHEAQRLLQNERGLARLGLACTPLPEDAEVISISGDMMAAIEDQQIDSIFSRGVILDAQALTILWDRGYGDLAGCRPGAVYHSGLYERYLEHPINGSMAGAKRDVFMTFWDRDGIAIYALELSEGAQALSELRSITDVPCGVASSLYENRLGGRVAVLSYFPWSFMNTLGKRETMPRLMDYLSRDRFPVRVEGEYSVLPTLRTGPEGFLLQLINMSFDASGPLTLRVNARCDRLTAYNTEGAELSGAAVSPDTDDFVKISLPPLEGWQSLTLIGETDG